MTRGFVLLTLMVFLLSTAVAQSAQQTLFLSLQDNKKQRRVEALKDMLKRHGGDVRADRFEDAAEGEKGYRFNTVIIVPDKVAVALKKGMGASPIEAVSAQVTFKSKAGWFSKTVDQLDIDCPKDGFEATFSWYVNEFSRDPWGYFKRNYPREFKEHCDEVERAGKAKLRVNNPYMKLELFPKGFKAGAKSIFYESEEDFGDLYYDLEGGE